MSQTYYAILTAAGEAKLANAVALNVPLQISKMAVGDGNGALPNPIRAQTTLVHENYRADLNTLSVDPANNSQIIAELVIPEATGGWWIREMGLYDSAGVLVAVSNCPPSYKPQLAEGSGRTQVLRMVLIVTSTSAVELKIDPAVVLATRDFVTTTVAAELAKLDSKKSVLVATTANIARAGLLTVDGVVLAAGDRVLVKDQASGAENGIYTAAVGAWSRAADADENVDVTPGMLVPIEKGALNADSIWQLVTDAPITVGTTALVYEVAAGPTALTAGTYRSVSVDKRGRVVGGTNPTTLGGYGIAAATQPEAEAGTDDTKPATSKSVFWAIAKVVIQATETVLGVAKVATQAQTNAGTDDATFVTPKKLRLGFAISLGASGYLTLPAWLGGLIFQWGSVSLPQDAVGSMTFPIAFPTMCVLALASGTRNSVINGIAQTAMNCTAKSVTGASFANDDFAQTAQWFAIGY